MALEFTENLAREIHLSAVADKKSGKHTEIIIGLRDDALSDIPIEDLARMAYLSAFTDETNSVYSLEKKVYLTKKETAELLGGSLRNSMRQINRLITAGKLTETDNPPQIFLREFDSHVYDRPKSQQSYSVARWLLKWIYTMEEQKYTEYHSNPVKRLGALLRLIPFINWRYNILCENPKETRLEYVEPIGNYRMAKILGCEGSKSHKVFGQLCEIMSLPDGYFAPILWCLTEYDKECYVMNPEFCKTENLHWSVYSEMQFSGDRVIHDADYMTEREDTRRYDEDDDYEREIRGNLAALWEDEWSLC